MNTTMLPPLFTAEEYLSACYNVQDLPENVVQPRSRPRASGIAGCTRDIAYQMAGTEKTDIPRDDHGLDGRSDGWVTAEIGRAAEAVSIKIINEGLPGPIHVVRTGKDQIELSPESPSSGHPDGELCWCTDGCHRLDEFEDRGTPHPETGLVYGFEHKLPGRFAYKDLLTDGLEKSHPEWVQQVTVLGLELGWDAVCFVILAQDGSGVRYEYRQARDRNHKWVGKVPEVWNPKAMIVWLDIRGYKKVLEQGLRARAEAFTALNLDNDPTLAGDGATAPGDVRRDFQPDSQRFPCGWCDYRKRCLEDGQGTIEIPAAPMGHG